MISPDPHQLSHWQRDCRAFIKRQIYWLGSIGLVNLVDIMRISRPQVSKDLNGYITDHPGHLFYDKTVLSHVMGGGFKPHYLSTDPSEHLVDMAAVAQRVAVPKSDWIVDHPSTLTPTIPARGLAPTTVRNVLIARAQRQHLTKRYQLRSAPHATRPIVAHPALSNNQRRVSELGRGMTDGKAEGTVRTCRRFYTLNRLGLGTNPDTRDSQDQHIVPINRPNVHSALGRQTL